MCVFAEAVVYCALAKIQRLTRLIAKRPDAKETASGVLFMRNAPTKLMKIYYGKITNTTILINRLNKIIYLKLKIKIS